MDADPRRATPRTDAVLTDPEVAARIDQLGRERVKSVVAEVLAACRRGEVAPNQVVAAVLTALPSGASALRPVVNATGVIVHTNLGRAPLSAAAVEAVAGAAGATNVEFDLATGRRARRGVPALEALRQRVPDAEGVHVVNNGAAALALVTSVLARGRRVVIARGELVEIGDGFRIPELMESVGAELREVGTTNRVRLSDYEKAVDDSVAFVLKVHPSNFRIEGFASAVSTDELARIGPPLVVDIGSGLLAPHPRLPAEPDATTVLRAGASLVTASGDKLLGGPQCGLLLGSGSLIEQLRRDPLARAMRVDKLTLAALEATLTGPATPVETALSADAAGLMTRARAIATAIGPPADVVLTLGRVGGGGAPGVELESAAVALPQEWADPLRAGEHAVVGRVHDRRLLLDLLAVPDDQDRVIIDAVRAVAAAHEG
ncbi:MAG: L-seryl-tRNA(Sec) selenium transferase [Marmoricola sp.]